MTKKIETQPVKVETPKIIIATAEYERIMLEAQNELEEEIKAYNAAVRAKNLDDMNKHNTACVAAKNRYNENARTMFYAECCNEVDPLLAAVKLHSYKGISFRDAKEKDCDLVIRKSTEPEYFVQLASFKKWAETALGHTIGANEKWLVMIEKFAQLITFYAAQEIGIDPKMIADTYAIRSIAREIELGKTPTSKTQIQKQLQEVVTAMIGEGDEELNFKVTTHDAAFIRLLFAKKSRRALTVAASSAKEMTALVAQVCHRVATGEDYRIEYKTAKVSA